VLIGRAKFELATNGLKVRWNLVLTSIVGAALTATELGTSAMAVLAVSLIAWLPVCYQIN
jgi:hypothetical protein